MSSEITSFYGDIRGIIQQARQTAYSAVNSAMVAAYWQIGRRIVEEEQGGAKRAEYGKGLLKNLSAQLTKEFGSGFSPQSLANFRLFYQTFPDLSSNKILYTLCRKLSWSHFRLLMKLQDSEARDWYLKESAEQGWSVRTMDRNIATLYYERLRSSQLKEPVVQEMMENTASSQADKYEFIKSPYVLEFLNLPSNIAHLESDLEKSLLTHLQSFLLELGKGFAFIGSQYHVQTETTDYFIDLVFYNYILKCFILIDLKTGRINHQDVGQMDMYIRMFDELKRGESDNPTIGLVLCSETDEAIARYSVLNGNEQLFAGKYKLWLPSEEELKKEIERERAVFMMQKSLENKEQE